MARLRDARETPERQRVQMDMPPRSIARLERLKAITEASSYAEVIRNALQLYEALILESEAGNEVFVKRGDNLAPMPIFGA